MIDINPESSISVSNSNSMLSKSPTSFTTATDDGGKGSMSGTVNTENRARDSSSGPIKCDGSMIVHQVGTGTSVTPSENDSRIPSISQQSATELKQFCHSESNYSAQSWGSIISLDSPSEDEALEFMRRFVAILFEDSSMLTLELKSEFGEKSRVSLTNLQICSVPKKKKKTFKLTVFHFPHGRLRLAACGLHVWSVHSAQMQSVSQKIHSTLWCSTLLSFCSNVEKATIFRQRKFLWTCALHSITKVSFGHFLIHS